MSSMSASKFHFRKGTLSKVANRDHFRCCARLNPLLDTEAFQRSRHHLRRHFCRRTQLPKPNLLTFRFDSMARHLRRLVNVLHCRPHQRPENRCHFCRYSRFPQRLRNPLLHITTFQRPCCHLRRRCMPPARHLEPLPLPG